MDGFPGVAVVVFLDDPVDEERSNRVSILCGKRLLHLARTGIGSGDTMRDVGRAKRRGEKLSAQHVRVSLDRHLFHFPMEVGNGGR